MANSDQNSGCLLAVLKLIGIGRKASTGQALLIKDKDMRCDVCNATLSKGSGERLTPKEFLFLIDNGFGLDEANIKMLTDAGMSRSEAEAALKNQYRNYSADWLICPECAGKAKAIISGNPHKWVSPEYIAVTDTAAEVGAGFDIIGSPVALSRLVWQELVEWDDEDSERQTYQEQDARLWDVLFTGGNSLKIRLPLFLKNKVHTYSVECIPRDGEATESITIPLLMRIEMISNKSWLVIDKAEQ